MNLLTRLYESQNITDLLDKLDVTSIIKLDSMWRSNNLILLFNTRYLNGHSKRYIFKSLSQDEHIHEFQQLCLLAENYIDFVPKIHIQDNKAILMDYADGDNLFQIFKKITNSELSKSIEFIGEKLADKYGSYLGEKQIIQKNSQIRYTVDYYARDCLEKKLLKVNDFRRLEKNLGKWSNYMGNYIGQITHNDLNISNVLVTEEDLMTIDPEYDPLFTNDVAKDIGRYCASLFFNTYDYYLQQPYFAYNLVLTFYAKFTQNFPIDSFFDKRVLFYIAQSALSFSRFKTNGHLTPKEIFYTGYNLFAKNPDKANLCNLYEEFCKSKK